MAALAQGWLRPDYDDWQQAISALSLGPTGWVQDVSFVVFGFVLLTTVPVWRRTLAGGVGASAYPVLVALTGLSLIAVAWAPQDPAPGYDPERLGQTLPTSTGLAHLALAGVAAASSSASLFVMASRFSTIPHWSGWTAGSRGAGMLTIACVIVYAVWSTQPTGLAGAFERLVVIIPGVWGYAFVRRLTAGVPFVVSEAVSAGDGRHSPRHGEAL